MSDLTISLRVTRRWAAWGSYRGKRIIVYLPRMFRWFVDLGVYDFEEVGPDFLNEFSWLLAHEVCHNLRVKHGRDGWIWV